MSVTDARDNVPELLESNLRVPEHVVFRSFASETVVLNLETGTYHGLNPTGGRILELLERTKTVHDASARLAEEYGLELDAAERDVSGFCLDLLDRGLLETA
ncbi:MAG TPA: PqqD family protein [Gaiellaceae bacterium]|jgi:hypothetical protein